MVNMPLSVSAFPTDELGLETDINQNINQEYYEWLLKQHNYFPDCAVHKVIIVLICVLFTFSRFLMHRCAFALGMISLWRMELLDDYGVVDAPVYQCRG